MKLVEIVVAWATVAVCFVLLVFSFTRVGTGFWGRGNGLIWSYLFVVGLAALVFLPLLRRPTSVEPT